MNNHASIKIKRKLIRLEFNQVEVTNVLKFFVNATTETRNLTSFEVMKMEGKWRIMQAVPNWLQGHETLVISALKDHFTSSTQRSTGEDA